MKLKGATNPASSPVKTPLSMPDGSTAVVLEGAADEAVLVGDTVIVERLRRCSKCIRCGIKGTDDPDGRIITLVPSMSVVVFSEPTLDVADGVIGALVTVLEPETAWCWLLVFPGLYSLSLFEATSVVTASNEEVVTGTSLSLRDEAVISLMCNVSPGSEDACTMSSAKVLVV